MAPSATERHSVPVNRQMFERPVVETVHTNRIVGGNEYPGIDFVISYLWIPVAKLQRCELTPSGVLVDLPYSVFNMGFKAADVVENSIFDVF